jgi:hypothetical protein
MLPDRWPRVTFGNGDTPNRPGRKNRLRARLPLFRTDLSRDLGEGCAERGESVQDGHTALDLGHLTVEVPSGEALPRQLDAAVSGRLRL